MALQNRKVGAPTDSLKSTTWLSGAIEPRAADAAFAGDKRELATL
jgi:hypothetical protein